MSGEPSYFCIYEVAIRFPLKFNSQFYLDIVFI